MGGSSKKVTVGYKYYLGMHMILCHGPVDKIVRIRVDGRDAWVGNRRTGRISVNKPGLFGGESREGGIVGGIDFMPGEPTQGVNDYLASKLGSLVPAFRGVVGVVLRQVYIGLNPYLKKWDFRVSRVMTRQDGIPQWYPQTASIPTAEAFKVRQRILFALDDSGSMNQIVSGSRTRMDVMKDNMANVLDEIKILKMDSQVPVDLAIHRINGGGISYIDATPAQIDAVKAYVLGMTASGGTNFTGLFTYAKTWFTAHTGERRNVMVLVGDGVPDPASTFPDTLAEAAPILNRTGTWSGNNEVDVYAVNIDLGNTFYAEQMDNTPGDGVPVVDGSSPDELYNAVFFAFMGDSPAMNVVHAVRECLTDPTWGMGYAESDIDEASFRAAALRLRQERLGICLLWDRQKPIEDMIQELLKHADAALYVDRKTGLFKIKLIRDGYDTATLLHLTEENIVKIENFSRPSFGELTTSVTVNYWNVTTGSNASVTVQDIALASMQQAHVATTLQYPGLPDAVMASRVAQRSLKVLSSQLARCAIYADRSAKDVAIGDVVKVTWPEYDLQETVFRVIEVAYGDGRNNRIKLTVIEDSFGMPETAYVTPSEPEWENPSQAPQPITRQVAFEAPYLELVQRQSQDIVNALLATNPDAGYVGAAGVSPGGSAINARAYMNNGSGYEDIGLVDFSPGATLAADVDQMATTFLLAQTSALDGVNPGTWAQVGQELIAVVEIVGNSMTVKRGVLDSVPQIHLAGAAIIFWDESATVDDTEYVTSEQVAVKLAPVSGAGELELSSAAEMQVELRARAIRPYPPGNFQLNGLYYPEVLGGSLYITWAGRNRLQQTGGDLIGFPDSEITPEPGTTYTLKVSDSVTDQVFLTETGITASSYTIPAATLETFSTNLKVELWAVRGGFESYFSQSHVFVNDSGAIIVFTDFGPFSIGAVPPIFSFPWHPPQSSRNSVVARSGASSGKVYHLGTAAIQRVGAKWDGAWNSPDVEMTIICEHVGSVTTVSVLHGLIARMGGAATTEVGLNAWCQGSDSFTVQLQLGEYNNGASAAGWAVLPHHLEGPSTGIFATKFRAVGGLTLAKCWRLTSLSDDEALSEPPHWQCAFRPQNITTGNDIGFMAFNTTVDNYFDRVRAVVPTALKPLEFFTSHSSLFTTATNTVVQIPTATQVGDMLVLVLMRRAAVTSGLTGWTLVRSEALVSTTINQWVDIYVKTATAGDVTADYSAVKTVTVTCASSQRIQATLMLVSAPQGGTISVQGHAGSSNQLRNNANLVTIPSLAASGDNRLAIVACTCALQATSGANWMEVASPWQQIGPRLGRSTTDQTRMVVGIRTLSDGQNINSPATPFGSSQSGDQEYAVAAVILQTT